MKKLDKLEASRIIAGLERMSLAVIECYRPEIKEWTLNKLKERHIENLNFSDTEILVRAKGTKLIEIGSLVALEFLKFKTIKKITK